MNLSNKVLLSFWLCASLCTVSGASQFIPLGFLDPNDPMSLATGVDANGDTIVGESTLNGQTSVFIWRQSNGIQPLELPNGANVANAISTDGKTIVGRA